MSDKNTIHINEFELQKCDGNLKTLAEEWKTMPFIDKDSFSASKGISVNGAKTALSYSLDIQKELGGMLEKSVVFFESVGVHFKTADSEAAKNTDNLVS